MGRSCTRSSAASASTCSCSRSSSPALLLVDRLVAAAVGAALAARRRRRRPRRAQPGRGLRRAPPGRGSHARGRARREPHLDGSDARAHQRRRRPESRRCRVPGAAPSSRPTSAARSSTASTTAPEFFGDAARRRGAGRLCAGAPTARAAERRRRGEQLSLADAAAAEPDGEEARARLPRGREAPAGCCPTRRCCSASASHTGETPDAIRSVSRRLVETLGHFGIAAQVIGTVSGPRVTRYELQLAPGIKVSRVAVAQGRPRLRAGGHRHPRAGADPRQDGGRRRGAQRAGQLRVARRHPPALPAQRLADGLLARQGRLRQGRPRRPRADGAPAHRRHHRLGQERLPQRPHQLDPAARHARRGAHDHDRPEEGRALATSTASRTCWRRSSPT